MRTARVSLLVSLLLAANACASHSEVESGETTDDALDALVGATCSEDQARRVDVALELGTTCSNVEGSRGSWIARPLFPDAPEDVRAQSCRFTWQGSGGSRPDRAALEADVHGVLSPSCARGKVPSVEPLEDADDEPVILPQGGSIGCDVCGKNRDRKGWIVLPPDQRGGRSLVLRVARATSEGSMATADARFRVAVPKNATALTVTLPRPPAGQHYVPDSLRVGGL